MRAGSSGRASSEAPISIALLGCGRIARLIHVPMLARMPGVRVAVAADPQAGAREEAARRLGARAVAGFEEALDEPGVDAAVICLPSGMHAPAAVAALERGLHVFIEKPVATDVEQARTLTAAARTRPELVVMPAFNYRFHAVWERMRRRLAEGAIGEVVAVRTAFCVPARALPAWKSARVGGGGCLLDQFSHHADLLAWLLDAQLGPGARPREVDACVRSLVTEEDTASVRTVLASGVMVDSLLSLTAAETDRIEITGTKGRLIGDRLAGQVWLEPRSVGYRRAARAKAAAAAGVRAAGLVSHVLRPGGDTGHGGALAEFRDAVREGRAPAVTLDDGVKSLAWVLAAEESGRSGVRRMPADFVPCGPAGESGSRAAAVAAESAGAPEISIVLVVSHVDHTVRTVVRCVRAQTVASRAELIVVTPDEERAERALSLPTGVREMMGSVCVIETGAPIRDVDAEAARGVLAARAEVVAVIEDHAFPEPEWAEALLAAHAAPGGPWAAVGSCIINANPGTGMSWMNLLLGYGTWCPPVSAGETSEVSLHNISLKRSAVEGYGETLGRRMGRGGDLLADLRRNGYRLRVEPRARVRHINPSRLASSVELRFHGGRVYAAGKACAWPMHKRLAYAAMWPVIPLLRFRLLKGKLATAGWRFAPAVAMGLVLDGLGQMTGFALGAGESRRRLAAFELDRLRHLAPSDRRELARVGAESRVEAR